MAAPAAIEECMSGVLAFATTHPERTEVIYSTDLAQRIERLLAEKQTAGVAALTIVEALDAVGKVVIVGGFARDVINAPASQQPSIPGCKDIDLQFEILPEQAADVRRALAQISFLDMEQIVIKDLTPALERPALYLKLGALMEGHTLQKNGLAENDVNSMRYVVRDRVLVDVVGTGLAQCRCNTFSVLMTGRASATGTAYADFASWFAAVPAYYRNSVHMRIGKMFVKGYSLLPLERAKFKEWFQSDAGSASFLKSAAYLLNFCGVQTTAKLDGDPPTFKGFVVASTKNYDGAFLEQYWRCLREVVGEHDPTVNSLEQHLSELVALEVGALLPAV